MSQVAVKRCSGHFPQPKRQTHLLGSVVRLCVLLGAALLLAVASARAQSGQGAITGTVKDSKGALVKGAVVTITNDETHVTLQTSTNQDGIYVLGSLNPANYTVTVSSPGFEEAVINNVTLSAAQQPTVDVSLKVGSTSTRVTVDAESALLSRDTSDVTSTVDHEIVENLPYPERSSLEAALLVPGVNGDPSVPGGIFSENPPITTGAVVPGASISIGGGPPGTGSILIDGSDVTQASYARAGTSLSGKNVAETTVITSGLSAQYGRTSAGVIIQASRAGTIQYHGAITYRHTDPFFNAAPLGTTSGSAQHENFFGAYFGGPVYLPGLRRTRDKIFFYASFEPARISTALTYPGIFPTNDDVAGNLQNTISLLNQSVLAASGYQAALAAPRTGMIYYQSTYNAQGFPDGPDTGTGTQVISGPGGVDDLSAIVANNPFAKFVLANLPSPSSPGPYIHYYHPDGSYNNNGYNATYKRGVSDIDNRYSIRIDAQITDRDKIYARYTVLPLNAPRFFALAASNPLVQSVTDTTDSHDLSFGYTHVFSSSIVNSFHYAFLRANEQRLPPASALQQDFAAKYGLTPATLGKGVPSLGSLFGSLQPGNTTPYTDLDQNFIAGDDLTWSFGKHLFQFGGETRWIQSNQYDNSSSFGGKYTFSASQTSNGTSGGTPLATFILGTITSFTATPVAVPGYYRWHYYAGYFQDNWRIASKLTLNLGARYEVEVPRREKFNNQALVQLNSPGILNGFPTTTAYCFSGACGTKRTLWPINWWGIEPRIGLAYLLTPRVTLRASYGIMRMPLTGYDYLPDPDLNIAAQSVTYNTGGQTPGNITNYVTNPVAGLTSAYTQLDGSRGPITYSPGFSPVYVPQTSAVPYTQARSFTVQWEPAAKTLLQLSYQGLKGTHLIGPFTGALNVPSVPTLVNAVQTHQLLGGSVSNTDGIRQNGATLTETGLQQLNPYQNFFDEPLTVIYPRIGNSSYNALNISINRRYGTGLSLLAFYTWSKSLDNVPDTNAGNSGTFGSAPQQNPLSIQGERSVSTFDQDSRFKAGYVYVLPLGAGHRLSTHHRWLDEAIGDISTSGLATVQSGFPLFTTLGSDGYFYSFTQGGTNGCSSASTAYCSAAALPTGYSLRPNIVPGVPLINKNWKQNPFGLNTGLPISSYLNPAAFTTPGSLNNPALGTSPRTLSDARSARETFFDAQVSKWVTFSPRYRARIFATFNNAFNHPVYFPGNTTALQTTPTTCTSVTTSTTSACYNVTPPGILFNPSTTFGDVNTVQTGALSRIIRIGAEFDF